MGPLNSKPKKETFFPNDESTRDKEFIFKQLSKNPCAFRYVDPSL